MNANDPDRWTVQELLSKHGDEIRRLRRDGNGTTKIAAHIRDKTGRYCSRSTVRSCFGRRRRERRKTAEVIAPAPVLAEPILMEPPPELPPITGPVDVSPMKPEDAEETIEELLERRLAETARSVRREASRFKVCRMPSKPFALAFFGDPHLDDPGCRWDLLLEDVRAARAPGVYCVSVGDHQNHWIGRLQKQFAEQGTTASEGWRLARWFLGAGPGTASLNWLIAVGGNHDAWSHSPGYDPYVELCRDSVRYYDDAEVRLRLTFNDELEPMTLLVRHDFPGRSIFHSTHGPAKAARLDHEADILAAGHLHSWAVLQQEVSGGRCPVAIRLRGYKHGDHYARERGFLESQHGHGAMLVIDPAVTGPGRVTVFWNMKNGAAYLKTLRAAENLRHR